MKKIIQKIRFKLFNTPYQGLIIRRTRDTCFNKIDMLDLEILEVRQFTLKVKIICKAVRL